MFGLTRTPSTTDEVRASVNGTDVPQRDAFGALRWQVPPNVATLTFLPGGEPPPSSTVEVAYHVACL